MSSGTLGLLGLAGEKMAGAPPPEEDSQQQLVQSLIDSGWSPAEAYADLPSIEKEEQEEQIRRDTEFARKETDRRFAVSEGHRKMRRAPPAELGTVVSEFDRALEKAPTQAVQQHEKELQARYKDIFASEYSSYWDMDRDGFIRHLKGKSPEFRTIADRLQKIQNQSSLREKERTQAASLRQVEAARASTKAVPHSMHGLTDGGLGLMLATKEAELAEKRGALRQQFANWGRGAVSSEELANLPVDSKLEQEIASLKEAAETRAYGKQFRQAQLTTRPKDPVTGEEGPNLRERYAQDFRQLRDPSTIGALVGKGGTLLVPPQESFSPEHLAKAPTDALIDPTTGKLKPHIYQSMMHTMKDGMIAYGPTQKERTGRHYEPSAEAMEQHKASRMEQQKAGWEQEYRTRAQEAGEWIEPTEAEKAEGIAGHWEPGQVSVGRAPTELEGEFAVPEEIGGVKRLGLEWGDVPLVAAGVGSQIASYMSKPEFRGEFADAIMASPGKILKIAKRLFFLPEDTVVELGRLAKDVSEGAPLLRRDLENMGKKIGEEWAKNDQRLEGMPDRSYVQEAWDLSQGLVFGLTDISVRATNKLLSNDDLGQLAEGFVDGALEFATPMVHSAYHSGIVYDGKGLTGLKMGATWDKAPLEAALNLLMVKAPVVNRMRKFTEPAMKAAHKAKLRIREELVERLDSLNPDPLPTSVAGPYPKEWAVQKWKSHEPRIERLRADAEARMKVVDEHNTNAWSLQILADALDAAGIIPGDYLFTPLQIVKNTYRRLREGAVGKASARWWLAPRDVRLPLTYQTMVREHMAAHDQRILDIQDAVRMVPKKHRPLVEEFMWMEHRPLFDVNPAESLVFWDKSVGAWKLTKKGEVDVGGVWSTKESKMILSTAVPTKKMLALRTEVASKISAANLYGRNLVRQVHELTEIATREGMFADPMTLREVYWPNLYKRPGFVKRSWESWSQRGKGTPRMGPASHGGEFLTRKLQALEIPIEARLVPVGVKIPDRVINMTKAGPEGWIELPKHLEEYSMRQDVSAGPNNKITVRHFFHPHEYLKGRNVEGPKKWRKGGFGMSAGLVNDAMEGLGRLSFDVQNQVLFKKMYNDTRIVSDKPKEGFILVDDVEMRPGMAAQWKNILKKATPDALLERARQANLPFNLRESYRIAVRRGSKSAKVIRKQLIDEIAAKRPKKYGQLSKKYVQEDVWHEMVNVQKYADEASTWYRGLLRNWKSGKTAWSMTTTARNILSNVLLFAPMAEISVFNPLNWQFYKQAVSDAFGTKKSVHYKEAFVDGAFQGTFHRTELKGLMPGSAVRRLRGAKDGHQFATQLFNIAADVSTGAAKVMDMPGFLYGVVDDIHRQAYHHKFKTRLGTFGDGMSGRRLAAKNARKFFIDYESVQGFVQVVRAPFRPTVAKPGELTKGGQPVMKHGQPVKTYDVVESTRKPSDLPVTFYMAAQPFLAFTARALPLVADWMSNSPYKSAAYLNLYDHLNRLAMQEAGLDPEGVYQSIENAPFWERLRYAPVGLLGRYMGEDPSEIRERYKEAKRTPTMDIAYMTPFDMITGQMDKYAIGTWPKLKQMAGKLSLGNNPMIGPLLSVIANWDAFLQKPISNESLSSAIQSKQKLGYLLNAYLPPITPSPTDVFNGLGMLSGGKFDELKESMFSPAEGDLNELEHIKGGYTYEMVRSAIKQIPNARGIILSLSDAIFRLGGLKIKESDSDDNMLYQAETAARHVRNAMAPTKYDKGISGTGSLLELEGVIGIEARGLACRRALVHVETLERTLLAYGPLTAEGEKIRREFLKASTDFIDAQAVENNENNAYDKLLDVLASVTRHGVTAREERTREAKKVLRDSISGPPEPSYNQEQYDDEGGIE